MALVSSKIAGRESYKATYEDEVPRIGCSVLIGSITARSYSSQDYWLTTPVTKILEERRNEDGMLEYIRFKTQNSEYELVG